ncbi:MAG: hypothetical protein JWQ27_1280 [Ferruginibacter sp.]|nr:hypothetical protein [Ferruginibacter sp.]
MYYLIYGLLYLFSLLPFFILYAISDFAAFLLYRVFGYRKAIVINNLRIAFPEKNEAEINSIAKKFYTNLCDTFIETIKLLSLSESRIRKRAVIDLDECNALAAKGKNIQFHSGHQMNWEYANYAIALNLKAPWVGVYMRINNKALNKIFYDMRERYGTVLVAAQEFRTRMHSVFNKQYTLGLAADQNPGTPAAASWLYFFGRPTSFVTGPDKGARKNNTAVVFVKFVKVKRGYYRYEPTLITENGADLKEGELTLLYRDFLEQTIRQEPDNYLWSHRRWKWPWLPEYSGKWIDHSPMP